MLIVFLYFLILLYCFSMFLIACAALDGLGWVGDGPDVAGNGWDVMGLLLLLLLLLSVRPSVRSSVLLP